MVFTPKKPCSFQAGMISVVPCTPWLSMVWVWRSGTVAPWAKASRSAGIRVRKGRAARHCSASNCFMVVAMGWESDLPGDRARPWCMEAAVALIPGGSRNDSEEALHRIG